MSYIHYWVQSGLYYVKLLVCIFLTHLSFILCRFKYIFVVVWNLWHVFCSTCMIKVFLLTSFKAKKQCGIKRVKYRKRIHTDYWTRCSPALDWLWTNKTLHLPATVCLWQTGCHNSTRQLEHIGVTRLKNLLFTIAERSTKTRHGIRF